MSNIEVDEIAFDASKTGGSVICEDTTVYHRYKVSFGLEEDELAHLHAIYFCDSSDDLRRESSMKLSRISEIIDETTNVLNDWGYEVEHSFE